MMGLPRFSRPQGVDGQLSPNLYVANCGPAVGLSLDTIASVFSKFGEVKGVYPADDSGARIIVSYFEESSAQAALKELHGHPCPVLGGRLLHICYSVVQPPCQVSDSVSVSLLDSELNIPGIHLFHDFVSAEEEEELLAAVDKRSWKSLSKRRVQHYGYEFCYDVHMYGMKESAIILQPSITLHPLAVGMHPVEVLSVERISSFPGLECAADLVLDQLTVNEYPPGVGLSPHIDTHSAFEGYIFSLSLAGPCIMEFRRYSDGIWLPKSASSSDMSVECPDKSSSFYRKAIYLPPRSMLLLSGEARYAWHHYIPHHKVDMVKDSVIRRSPRRVSFTFRKVRMGPCQCEFPQYCDSPR